MVTFHALFPAGIIRFVVPVPSRDKTKLAPVERDVLDLQAVKKLNWFLPLPYPLLPKVFWFLIEATPCSPNAFVFLSVAQLETPTTHDPYPEAVLLAPKALEKALLTVFCAPTAAAPSVPVTVLSVPNAAPQYPYVPTTFPQPPGITDPVPHAQLSLPPPTVWNMKLVIAAPPGVSYVKLLEPPATVDP
jgi:hypothetical protein